MLTDDEIKALLDGCEGVTIGPKSGPINSVYWNGTIAELCTRLLSAEAKVKVLEEAPREMVYETTHLSPQEDDGSHWAKISAATLERARIALQDIT
jgi:hypothetical protein